LRREVHFRSCLIAKREESFVFRSRKILKVGLGGSAVSQTGFDLMISSPSEYFQGPRIANRTRKDHEYTLEIQVQCLVDCKATEPGVADLTFPGDVVVPEIPALGFVGLEHPPGVEISSRRH
jgi:hypothetical protein